MPRKEKQPDLSRFSGRLAARIRMLRTKKDFSRDEFLVALQAAGLTVGKSTVYAWENGNREINWEHVPYIAKALGTTVRTLMPNE